MAGVPFGCVPAGVLGLVSVLKSWPSCLPPSVLPKRIVEEVPSSDIPNDGEVAPDEVNWGPTPSTTTFESPSQPPTTENMLKGRLVGMMIWGFVVLLAGIATV